MFLAGSDHPATSRQQQIKRYRKTNMNLQKKPGWISSSFPFDANYEPFMHLWYYLDRDTKRKIHGEHGKKQCALCADPLAKFTKESHIIPASLGNRKYFSHEECDTCNEIYADAHDDHLAKMLMPERIFGKVPMRKGYPAFKAPDDSKIEWSKNLEELHIDNSLIHEESEKELIVKFELQPHNKLGALKSIMRSVWLAMLPIQRIRHKRLLEIIKGQHDMIDTEYGWLSLEPGLSVVILDCWQKHEGSKFVGSSLIIRLCIANTGILFGISEDACALPSPLPQFPDKVQTQFQIRRISSSDSSNEIRYINFVHNGRQDVQEDNATQAVVSDSLNKAPQRKREYPEESVCLRFPAIDPAWKIEGLTLRTCQESTSVLRYKVFGINIAGELIFHKEIRTNAYQFIINFDPEKYSLEQVKQTVLLLRDIQCHTGTMEFYASEDNALCFECTIKKATNANEIEKNADMLINLIDSLIILREFNSAIFLPRGNLPKKEYDEVLSLANLMKTRSLIEPGQTIVMPMPVPAIRKLLCMYDASRRNNTQIRLIPPFTLLGQELYIAAGELVEIEYFDFEFCEDLLTIENQIRDRRNTEAVKISFRCSQIVHRLIQASPNTDKQMGAIENSSCA